MKRRVYQKTLVTLIAFCCMCSACTGEPSPEHSSEKTDTEITTSLDDEEDEDNTSSESIKDGEPTITEKPESEPEIVSTPSDPQQDEITSPARLGAGNITNGGFATGDDKYVYYVTHGSSDRRSIVRENRSTHETDFIYTTVPKDNPVIDCLNLADGKLIFRENQSEAGTYAIYSLDLNGTTDYEVLADADIANVTLYGGRLYFSKDGSLVSTDLSGKDEKTLFTSEHSSITAKVAFSIANDTIYFSDPANFATGGMFFGKLYSMDLDGNNQTEIPAGVEVCNDDIFFTDGKALYFFGNTESDGSGYYTCNLDGTGLDMTAKAAPTAKNICGKYEVVCDAHEMYVDKDGRGHELMHNEEMASAKIVLVGDDIYYLGKEGNKTVTKRIAISGANETLLG